MNKSRHITTRCRCLTSRLLLLQVSGPAPVPRLSAASQRRISCHRPGPLAGSHPASWNGELSDTHAMICDVSSETQVRDAVANIRKSYGAPNVLIHNAVGGGWGTFLEIEPKMLDRNFQVNVMGLLYLARELAPDMIKAGSGTILVTGNTSAIRGKANFAGFAPTKAAQRILSEFDRARSRTARYPCRLCPDRCRDRCPAHARTSAGSAGRVLYQAIRDRGRIVAPVRAGPFGVVLPY